MQGLDRNNRWVDLSGQQAEVDFDMLSRIDIYSVLEKPTTPWYFDKTSHPWVTALGFACYSCDTVGKTDIETASDAIVKHLFSGHDLIYDHNTAVASYTTEASDKKTKRFLYNRFDLTDYMFVNNQKTYLQTNLGAKGPYGFVNCKDQACAVTSLVNLLKGGSATYINHNRFGYIKAAEHVGGAKANNPLFWHLGYNKINLLGAGPAYLTDLTWADRKVKNQRRRSFFYLHAYSLINSS